MEPFSHPDVRKELDEFRSAMQQVADRFAGMMLNMARDERIVNTTEPKDVMSLSALAVPEGEGRSIDDVLHEAFGIYDYRLRTNHPRFFGFIPSPASPLSVLAESFNSTFNTFAGCKLEGSGPCLVEKTLIAWLSQRIGLPTTSGGVFLSGGSMANMTAIAVARDQKLPQGKQNLGVAYISDQTHSSVAKALRILGFANTQIRCLRSDDEFRFIPETLQESIQAEQKAGLIPFVVIATCGTTNTGSIDPISKIAEICRKENVWLHVDGAYGASVALSTSHSNLIYGLGQADSVSWDAHKWLFQTYGCGLILVRDKLNLLDSFATDADYLRDTTEEEDIPNFWNYSMELTRPARGLKLWFTLRVLGVDVIGRMIDQGFYLAERAEAELRNGENWEIISPASMAILTFRYAPPDKTEDEVEALNVALSKKLLSENVAGILTTKVRGRVALRICAINPRLSGEGMTNVIHNIDHVARNM
jgi:glutamate/tyrosine decarboxylase-like PLP-dependent enzyme